MAQISISNLNRPTSAKWGKVALAATFTSQTILGMAISADNHVMMWIAFGCQLTAGLIPIFTNGVAPEMKKGSDSSAP